MSDGDETAALKARITKLEREVTDLTKRLVRLERAGTTPIKR
jgi:hypothetical protein